jgi:hypothetical protein
LWLLLPSLCSLRLLLLSLGSLRLLLASLASLRLLLVSLRTCSCITEDSLIRINEVAKWSSNIVEQKGLSQGEGSIFYCTSKVLAMYGFCQAR